MGGQEGQNPEPARTDSATLPPPPFIISDLTAEMLKHTFRMTTRAGDGLHNAAGSQQMFQPLQVTPSGEIGRVGKLPDGRWHRGVGGWHATTCRACRLSTEGRRDPQMGQGEAGRATGLQPSTGPAAGCPSCSAGTASSFHLQVTQEASLQRINPNQVTGVVLQFKNALSSFLG